MRAETETARITGVNFSLSDLLTPIDPDPEFVNSLKGRLFRPAAVTVESEPRTWNALLLIGLGIFSGVLLVWGLKKTLGLYRS